MGSDSSSVVPISAAQSPENINKFISSFSDEFLGQVSLLGVDIYDVDASNIILLKKNRKLSYKFWNGEDVFIGSIAMWDTKIQIFTFCVHVFRNYKFLIVNLPMQVHQNIVEYIENEKNPIYRKDLLEKIVFFYSNQKVYQNLIPKKSNEPAQKPRKRIPKKSKKQKKIQIPQMVINTPLSITGSEKGSYSSQSGSQKIQQISIGLKSPDKSRSKRNSNNSDLMTTSSGTARNRASSANQRQRKSDSVLESDFHLYSTEGKINTPEIYKDNSRAKSEVYYEEEEEDVDYNDNEEYSNNNNKTQNNNIKPREIQKLSQYPPPPSSNKRYNKDFAIHSNLNENLNQSYTDITSATFTDQTTSNKYSYANNNSGISSANNKSYSNESPVRKSRNINNKNNDTKNNNKRSRSSNNRTSSNNRNSSNNNNSNRSSNNNRNSSNNDNNNAKVKSREFPPKKSHSNHQQNNNNKVHHHNNNNNQNNDSNNINRNHHRNSNNNDNIKRRRSSQNDSEYYNENDQEAKRDNRNNENNHGHRHQSANNAHSPNHISNNSDKNVVNGSSRNRSSSSGRRKIRVKKNAIQKVPTSYQSRAQSQPRTSLKRIKYAKDANEFASNIAFFSSEEEDRRIKQKQIQRNMDDFYKKVGNNLKVNSLNKDNEESSGSLSFFDLTNRQINKYQNSDDEIDVQHVVPDYSSVDFTKTSNKQKVSNQEKNKNQSQIKKNDDLNSESRDFSVSSYIKSLTQPKNVEIQENSSSSKKKNRNRNKKIKLNNESNSSSFFSDFKVDAKRTEDEKNKIWKSINLDSKNDKSSKFTKPRPETDLIDDENPSSSSTLSSHRSNNSKRSRADSVRSNSSTKRNRRKQISSNNTKTKNQQKEIDTNTKKVNQSKSQRPRAESVHSHHSYRQKDNELKKFVEPKNIVSKNSNSDSSTNNSRRRRKNSNLSSENLNDEQSKTKNSSSNRPKSVTSSKKFCEKHCEYLFSPNLENDDNLVNSKKNHIMVDVKYHKEINFLDE